MFISFHTQAKYSMFCPLTLSCTGEMNSYPPVRCPQSIFKYILASFMYVIHGIFYWLKKARYSRYLIRTFLGLEKTDPFTTNFHSLTFDTFCLLFLSVPFFIREVPACINWIFNYLSLIITCKLCICNQAYAFKWCQYACHLWRFLKIGDIALTIYFNRYLFFL